MEIKQWLVRFLNLILKPGQVTEVRALEASMQLLGKPGTLSGYFNDPEQLAAAVLTNIKHAKGVYIVLNVVSSDLLSRVVNLIRTICKAPTTADSDILERR